MGGEGKYRRRKRKEQLVNYFLYRTIARCVAGRPRHRTREKTRGSHPCPNNFALLSKVLRAMLSDQQWILR